MADPFEETNRALQEQGPQPFATLGGGRIPALQVDPEEDPFAATNRALSGQQPLSDLALAAQAVGQTSVTAEPPLGALRRGRIAFGADTFAEKQAAFLKQFPEGEIFEVPNTEITLFRRQPSESFRVFDPQTTRDLPADLVELFAQAGPEIAGETALALGSRGTSLLPRLGRAALGGALGEAAQQKAQIGLGTQRQSPAELAGAITAEGALSLTGAILGEGVAAGVSLVREGGVRGLLNPRRLFFETVMERTPAGSVTRAGEESIEAAARLREQGFDVPDPAIFEVTDQPVAKALGRQAISTVAEPMRRLRALSEARATAARTLSDPADRARTINEISGQLDKLERGVSEGLIRLMRNPRRITNEKALTDAMQVVGAWKQRSGEAVDDLYRIARAAEDPRFDLDPMLGTIDEIEEGIRGAGREQPVIGADGKPTGESTRPLIQFREIDSAVQREINKLKALDPDQPAVEGAAPMTEVLREARRNLQELALIDPRTGRTFVSPAARLKSAIDQVLENPLTNNRESQILWGKANKAAAERFRIMELATLVDITRVSNKGIEAISENADRLADLFITPGSRPNLVALSRAGGKEAIAPFQDLYLQSLARDPLNLTKRLDQMDAGTLRLLITRAEERVIREAARQLDQIDNAGIRQALRDQSRNQAFIGQLVFDQPRSAAISDLAVFVSNSGGPDSPVGTSVRAAINSEIFGRSRTLVDAATVLDRKKLESTLEGLERTGALQLLTPREIALWRDFERVSRVQDNVVDLAAGLQSAAVASDFRTLLFPVNPQTVVLEGLSAVQSLAENNIVGRLMTQPAGRNFLLVRKGERRVDPTWFRAVGAALLSMTNDEEFAVLGGEE